MAGADGRPTTDDVKGHLEETGGAVVGDSLEGDRRIDRTPGPAVQNIDRVAAKVKGLLHSER